MKKIKIFAASLLFVAAAVTGYKAWQNSHITPKEALMKANIEALARGMDWRCIGDSFKIVPINDDDGWQCLNDQGNSCCPIPDQL